ncbi:MAG: UDP-4-amino-4,6-dideoxy-N-acetyl-beta-L-altrosamine transaminase [Candidatus Anaerobiospirillum pullicola]|uniref:UDP-4-amino-4, 6-dideoxy-N-acetyl-beta-L-altrosamine transaminase n=1 Tax=Candidatus Anaerobiospirillum pullicola TaxID=2838451 RepID=A0A948TFV0_9GAMM|nr:UDP-4-amino-4,6-dideoxy-N-acetyl-beta-L-altrosamine transaminase [Candidatus Anaerobiospirillum pullicola]
MILYSTQCLDEDDIQAVERTLRSDFLTCGPRVTEFEECLCSFTDAKYAIATSNATAALHLSMMALDVGPEDEVWVSAISFVASANCARYCGATVRFIDVDPHTGNLDVHKLLAMLKDAETKHKPLPKAVVAVHLSGRPCELRFLQNLKQRYGFALVEDASHAIGATYENMMIGKTTFSDVVVFSFHPVKIITTAEGGACLTDNEELAHRIRLLHAHGITHDPLEMVAPDAFNKPGYYYEQLELGFNYRMSDIQAALGISQMGKIESFLQKRRQLARDYEDILDQNLVKLPVKDAPGFESSWHLYQIQVEHRDALYNILRKKGVGAQIHYIPIYQQPYYQKQKYHEPLEGAEYFFAHTLTIPLHPKVTRVDQTMVASIIAAALEKLNATAEPQEADSQLCEQIAHDLKD